MDIARSITRAVLSLLVLYTAIPCFAENNQFAVELTNNNTEWNLQHSIASADRVNHANEMMTLLTRPQSVEVFPQENTHQKINVFDKKGNLIAVKTLDSNGKVIDVEFISKVENIDRKSGAASKNTQSEELNFMQNASESDDVIAGMEI